MQPTAAPNRDVFEAVAEVSFVPQGSPSGLTGTAWLCAPGFALTAAHCVGATSSPPATGLVSLRFPRSMVPSPFAATIVWYDPNLDAALLQLPAGAPEPGVMPLRTAPLSPQPYPQAREKGWYAYGFPQAQSTGLILSGIITSTAAILNGQPALQLECSQGGHGYLYGASGAAVCCDGAAVALLHNSVPRLGQQVLYATPLSLIWVALQKAHIAGFSLPADGLSVPHPLLRYPRRLVPFEWIPLSLKETFASVFRDPAAMTNTVLGAARFRREADPQDPQVRALRVIDLPFPVGTPAIQYWTDAFTIACTQGARMLAALILMAPEEVFDNSAQRERDELLSKLETL